MRKLIYTFADGRTVDTYTQAVKIAQAESLRFIADVVPIEKAYKVEKIGLRDKYKDYFAK